MSLHDVEWLAVFITVDLYKTEMWMKVNKMKRLRDWGNLIWISIHQFNLLTLIKSPNKQFHFNRSNEMQIQISNNTKTTGTLNNVHFIYRTTNANVKLKSKQQYNIQNDGSFIYRITHINTSTNTNKTFFRDERYGNQSTKPSYKRENESESLN